MKKFFITGVSGFIGRHLTKRLLETGNHVDFPAHAGHEIPEFHKAYNWRLVDSFELKKTRYDYVINLGATTKIGTDFNADIFFNNIIFAQEVMNTPFRTIYASSTSVYELINPYAYSKAFNEHLGRRHGNALGLRFFNVYGHGNNKGIVKRTIDCILTGQTLEMTGGNLVRDFIYIEDVVDIIIDHLDSPLYVMDVGTGVGTSIKDVVKHVFNAMVQMNIVPDKKAFIIQNIEKDHSNEQLVSVAKSNPVKEYTPLSEGIIKTIEQTIK